MFTLQVCHALAKQLTVKRFQVINSRRWEQEVAADIPHFILDIAFLLRAVRVAELRLVSVIHGKAHEHLG